MCFHVRRVGHGRQDADKMMMAGSESGGVPIDGGPHSLSRLAGIGHRLVGLPPASPQALRMIEDSFIDTLGCVLSGNRLPEAAALLTAAGTLGDGPAPVLGTGARLAAPQAAFVNATAAHLEEMDDWEVPGNTHPSAVIWPAIWALSAIRPVTGGQAVMAYAAGFEAIARLGEAVNFDHYNRGWHSTATLGVVGAAVATAAALRLDGDRMAAAIGLALTQASGYAAQFGSLVKPMQAGFAARDGLSSAIMAEAGLKGHDGILDGERGFVALMAGTGTERLDVAIDAIDGRALDQWGLATKIYPCCSYTHRLADCAVALHGRCDLAKIDRIEAWIPDFHHAILAYDRPQTTVQARFSLPFVIAACLCRGQLTKDHLADPPAAGADIWALIDRTHVTIVTPRRPEMNFDPQQPDRLQIRLVSGDILEESRAFPEGAPQAPVSRARLMAKFATNVAPLVAHPALQSWAEAGDLAACLDEVTA